MWGATFIFAVLLLKPEVAVSSAQRAMRIWYNSVAPSLFPFLVLMPLLTGKEACTAYESMFSRWMQPLFRLPGSAAPAVIAGMIAGSPGGAITLRRAVANSNMTVSEVRHIALAVGGVSPAYLIMGVGQGLHGSVTVGIKLAAIQVCIQLLMLVLLRYSKQNSERAICIGLEELQRSSVVAAVESVLGICGYMVFFSVVAGVVASLLGKKLGESLLLIMDLPSGLAAFAERRIPMKMIFQGAAIGFSGMCIIAQNMGELKELKIGWKEYMRARLLTAVLFAIACIGMEDELRVSAGKMMAEFRNTYAFSLFAAGIMLIPGLYLLSKKLFLNIRKGERT